MSSYDDTGNPVEEEIAFWRGFIEWWEAKEGKPATLRMREALAYAEAKRTLQDDGAGSHEIKRYRMH